MCADRCSMRVPRPQRAAIDLPGPKPGEWFFAEDYAIRKFEARQPSGEKTAEFLFAQRGLAVDDGNRHLAQPLVGSTEHRRFRDCTARIAFGFDFSGRDVLA